MNRETFEFQAEVSRVLDIVIHSLYTDREIFIRELISNAADALEKCRHHDLVNGRDPGALEIAITLDSDSHTITFADTGIGMSRDELIENLGRVAHSGAVDFLQKMAESGKKDIHLIGQFGVGFYSAFMVATEVCVDSRSAVDPTGGYRWISNGSSSYTIEPADDIPIGTTIRLSLKKDAEEFAQDWRIKDIIRKYSNFVSFPIQVNGERINTIQAIWSRSPQDVKEEEYKEFFKFTASAASDPLGWLHFSTDAPIDLKALLFISDENPERFGFGRMDSNINLYCKRVLIQRQAKDLLPLWLRFLSGVVDSEDLPLNISRETMQDSALIRKINRVLTKRVLKYLKEMAEKKPDEYRKVWDKFGSFIKEGIVTEFSDRDALAELIRFETSMTDSGQQASLADYLERMPESQKEIYYLAGPNRASIESGPYIEVFRKRGIEVIYNFDPVDDFVMHHLASYKDRKTVSADSEALELPDDIQSETTPGEEKTGSISEDDVRAIGDWIRSKLQDKVAEVKASTRLVDSPLILVNPDGSMTGAMQRLMEAAGKDFPPAVRRNLEFNPNHTLIKKLNQLRSANETQATLVIEQLYDHAALNAGLTVETRSIVDRMNRILSVLLDR
ncbi:molecular chaperone HtpG [bacterium]|nr:molecular chaperone HtpG [candidate division CSSED10-310 bacterium]